MGKYVVRSTKETSRILAEEVAEELVISLKQKGLVGGVPRNRQFERFAEILIAEQKKVAGKGRGKTYAIDDIRKLNRKDVGILDYFGTMDVASITTPKLREYINFLDAKREKPLTSSSKMATCLRPKVPDWAPVSKPVFLIDMMST